MSGLAGYVELWIGIVFANWGSTEYQAGCEDICIHWLMYFAKWQNVDETLIPLMKLKIRTHGKRLIFSREQGPSIRYDLDGKCIYPYGGYSGSVVKLKSLSTVVANWLVMITSVGCVRSGRKSHIRGSATFRRVVLEAT